MVKPKLYKIVDNRLSLDEIKNPDELYLIDEFCELTIEEQKEARFAFENGTSPDKIIDLCKKLKLKREAQKLKAEANMSKRFKKRTFETYNAYSFELKEALRKAKKYASLLPQMLEDGTNLIFEGHGCVGTGKTHLACAIANYALDSGIPTKVFSATNLASAVSYNALDKELKKYLLNSPLLVLDDLGKECGYDWLLAELYGILNYRYENCKPTIITTEDTIKDLRSRYKVKTENGIKDHGKSIFSRICENVVIIPVKGDDYRLKRFELN